jgi:hypothetical protein
MGDMMPRFLDELLIFHAFDFPCIPSKGCSYPFFFNGIKDALTLFSSTEGPGFTQIRHGVIHFA